MSSVTLRKLAQTMHDPCACALVAQAVHSWFLLSCSQCLVGWWPEASALVAFHTGDFNTSDTLFSMAMCFLQPRMTLARTLKLFKLCLIMPLGLQA